MHNFYVSDPIHPDALTELRELGRVHLGFGDEAVRYIDICGDVDAVLLRAETFTRDMIAASPKLTIIARHGVGTDNVDLHAAAECRVWVTTTPGSNSRAVAEHVFALLLSIARRTPTASAGVAAGRWADLKPSLNGVELGGRTLGLVGFGNIARIVADIARGFGMHVQVADPFVDDSVVTAAGATRVSFDDLVVASDVISLHVPLTDDTAHVIDADVMRRMRPGCILVNTSRGGLIDESALLDALTDGHLRGAALDVLSGESIDMKNPLPFTALSDHNTGLDNLIITPHIAGQTDRALLTAGREAVDCIRTALAGRAPRNAVAPVSSDATPADARR